MAVSALAGAEAALAWTLQYRKERQGVRKALIGSFQNSRFGNWPR